MIMFHCGEKSSSMDKRLNVKMLSESYKVQLLYFNEIYQYIIVVPIACNKSISRIVLLYFLLLEYVGTYFNPDRP